VARFGGFRRASLALGISHAVISRHINALEAWTSTTLLQRNRYGAQLTEDGLRYHREIAAALGMIARATEGLLRRGDQPILHIWAIAGFAVQWLQPRLAEFETLHPEIKVEVHPNDVGPDFIGREADIDIRYISTLEPSPAIPSYVEKIEFAKPAMVPIASPGYVANIPPITHPGDLLHFNLIHGDSDTNWRAWFRVHGVETGSTSLPGTRLWHANLTTDAARRGRGVALGNYLVNRDLLSSGNIVEVGAGLPGFARLPLGAYVLLARADRWSTPLIENFRNWLLNAVAAEIENLPRP
jgi:DNA-binding transcriptional LysR family regulator